MNRLVKTSDGSHTIYVPEIDEHYHSVHGAVQESEIVYIRGGYEYSEPDPLNILEVGFGTGLNTLLTAVRATKDKRKVFYTSIEKYPVSNDIVSALNHYQFAGAEGNGLFEDIHRAQWGKTTEISEYFSLHKIKCDLVSDAIEGNYDLFYFDAFGPDKQPEMWTENIFAKIAAASHCGSVFVTYSSKGTVKRMLRAFDFAVTLIPGPPGKRQMIRAVKQI